MSGLIYYVLDCETTGLSTVTQEMCEISIIRCHDRLQLSEVIKCERPEAASADALRITNKTFDDLLKGNAKEYVVDRVDRFLSEDGLTPNHRVCIGHNVSFDRRFCYALWDKVGKEFQINLWLDSMALTKIYAKQMGLIKPKVNLNASCDMLGIKKLAGQHSAKGDTRNTYLLWKNLTEKHGIDSLPLIKTIPHVVKRSEYEEPDLSILEGIDDEDF